MRYGLPANGKSPDRVYSVISNRYGEVAYGYDTLGRLTSRAVTTPELYTQYTYEDGAVNGRTTARVSQVNGINGTFAYAYNAMGSITEVKKNGTVIESYTYDALGRLTAATVNGTAYAYTYDSSGNLLTHRRDSDTAAYVYGDPTWGDLLTNYNGTSISYDTIGNPLNWRDGMAMTWQYRRELSSVTKGGKTFAYSYGADGVRTQKTVDGVTTEYYTVGGKLLAEKTGDQVLTFHYDEKGTPVSVELDGTRYFYCLNLQGDVVGLKTSSSYDQLVVEYTYDPWGKLLSITDTSGTNIGTLNPLRYRGYYYDTETGFYFLQSRYYDPTVGRFINADGQLSGVGGDMQGYNLFAYCQNDPVNMSDPTGHWPQWIKNAASAVVNAVKKAVTVVANTVKSAVSSASNILKASSNSLPKKGEPGSSQTLPNPDGTPKQKRWYGPDGNPERDRDYNHPGNMPFPHDHEWKNGERGKEHLLPDPSYKMSWEPVIGAGLVVICTVGIIAVAADDLTGVGVADDFLFGPLGAGVGEGLIMIFG